MVSRRDSAAVEQLRLGLRVATIQLAPRGNQRHGRAPGQLAQLVERGVIGQFGPVARKGVLISTRAFI